MYFDNFQTTLVVVLALGAIVKKKTQCRFASTQIMNRKTGHVREHVKSTVEIRQYSPILFIKRSDSCKSYSFLFQRKEVRLELSVRLQKERLTPVCTKIYLFSAIKWFMNFLVKLRVLFTKQSPKGATCFLRFLGCSNRAQNHFLLGQLFTTNPVQFNKAFADNG